MTKVSKRTILRQGWWGCEKAIGERTCPKCGSLTQILITNDGKHEYIAGERCPAGCFKIIHKEQ